MFLTASLLGEFMVKTDATRSPHMWVPVFNIGGLFIIKLVCLNTPLKVILIFWFAAGKKDLFIKQAPFSFHDDVLRVETWRLKTDHIL